MSGWTIPHENKAYADILYMHLRQMAHFLGNIPPEKLDFTYDQAAPTPRTLAVHTLQWLICDRYHIEEPDAARHPRVPDPPDDPAALCDALLAEAETWRALLLALTPARLAEPRRQFNQGEMNVRAFVAHIVQNTIYKSGQLSYLYYALGLDGIGPYEAPFPNDIYQEVFRPRP